MGLLDKLRRHTDEIRPSESAADEAACLHVALLPQWATAADMGNEDRASQWVCPSCQQAFTPDEARALRATEADRLKEALHVR